MPVAALSPHILACRLAITLLAILRLFALLKLRLQIFPYFLLGVIHFQSHCSTSRFSYASWIHFLAPADSRGELEPILTTSLSSIRAQTFHSTTYLAYQRRMTAFEAYTSRSKFHGRCRINHCGTAFPTCSDHVRNADNTTLECPASKTT